jgi:hypothetical protein
MTVRHLDSGEVRLVGSTDGLDLDAWELLDVDPPTDAQLAAGWTWRGGAWAAPVKRLWPAEILALYTVAQRARARRLLTERHPEGHALAGQLVDPHGNVAALIDSLLAHRAPIALSDPWHVNGTALMRALGVLESDAEAGRVLAGEPFGPPPEPELP